MSNDFLRQAFEGSQRMATVLERLLQMQADPELTVTQQAAIDSSASRVIIAGGPASGKTTTLIAFAARRNPARRGIVFVRNQNERQMMERRLGCKVTHCTAATLGGFAVQNAPRSLRQNFAQALCPTTMAVRFGYQPYTAAMIIRTLEEFFASDDLTVGDQHVSRHDQIFASTLREISDAIDGAREVWGAMRAGTFAVTREAIFKMISLAGTQIPFDDILVDDAEDLSAAEIHFILGQRHASVILAGDPRQHLGAGESVFAAVSTIDADVHVIGDSFRMTPEVANLCNLMAPAGGTDPAFGAVTGRYDPRASISLAVSRRVLVSRWDGTLLERAARTCGDGIHWVGGCDAVARLFAICSLYKGLDSRVVPVPITERMGGPDQVGNEIAGFGQYAVLRDFAQHTGDRQLLSLVRIVEAYGHDTAELALHIFNNAISRHDDPACTDVFATAERAKGHRWANVTLADDFNVSLPFDPTERAHLYLACGRAEQHLEVPASIRKAMGITQAGSVVGSVSVESALTLR